MHSIVQLRAFVAVVEVGSVTAAASIVKRTQPQISRLVTDLEEEVGFALFVREGRRLVLTKRGALLYDEVRHALDSFDNVTQAAGRIREDVESELRILAPPYIAHTILPRSIATFKTRYPSRNFSVEIVIRNVMGVWLPYKPFDIAISALPFDLPSIRVSPFCLMPTVVAFPKGHPFGTKQVLTLADLEGHPYLAMNRNTGIRKRVDSIFEREGFTPNLAGETTNSISASEMVAEGVGWTIVDAIVGLTRNRDMIDTRPWLPGSDTEFGFIYPAGNATSPIVEEFADIVKEMVASLSSGEGDV